MIRLGFYKLLCSFAILVALAAADDDTYQCHDLYEFDASRKGTVSSPFYQSREHYHDGLWCEYRITAPKNYRIKITFKEMDIAPSSFCGEDYLGVFGKDRMSTLGVFCGSRLPFPILSNEGENEICLLFRSDAMVSGKGFLLEYESGPDLELCKAGHTECTNRNCYSSEKKCDGIDDCGDGTDEENCGFPIVSNPDGCGVPAIQPNTIYGSPDRMVGGESAVPNSWPWQVSLQATYSEPNGHFCGGTLINSQWVLTASHCVVGAPEPGQIKIHLGAHSKFKRTPYEQIRMSAKVIAFPDLEEDKIRYFSMQHDISLIKLNAPVQFNEGVQPACLPSHGWELKSGWLCYVTGWGETRGTGGSDVLKQMEQFIQPTSNCSYNKETQVCLEKRNNSPCHGDSGGPLQCKLAGKWYVFGAASFVTTSNLMGGLCTGPGAKTVYANVADKAEWIHKIIETYS